jgi:serine/threonine protein phosphatase PrpC
MKRAEGPAGHATRLELRFGIATDTGPREANEDYAAFYVGDQDEQARHGAVAVIADGVGGAAGGRVAAELAVRSFVEGHLGQNATLGVQRNSARTIEAFNSWAHAVGSRDPALAGMATTLTALVLRGRRVHVIHVGDTRAYRWRDGALDRMTADHAMAGAGLRHILTRAIGADESIRIDYASDTVRLYDRYLLSSDGIHSGVSDPAIAAILAQRNAPDETARELVAAGLAARIGDNATALVIDIIGLPPADPADLAFATAGLALLPVPKAGATIDGFHLCAMLADGRYTRVFEAEDLVEKRRVVLKFPKAITGAEGVLRDAVLREAWITARIRSPWIGETIELAPERQTGLYTVIPFYEGETLERRLLRPPRLSLTAGLDYAIKLAGGVAALHRAGVIHRDIKPDNVILEAIRDHQVPGLRLVDLGVARLPHMEDIPAAYAPGTPSYMAPELFTGAAGDEHSDQYALGVTIYRIFTGEYPYGEIEAFSHPRFKHATPLTKHRPDLPAWLDEALARSTAVDPQERFGDIFEFIFALEHGAIRAAPTSPRRPPLYERNPLLVWKIVAALLALALGASLALNPAIRHGPPAEKGATIQK